MEIDEMVIDDGFWGQLRSEIGAAVGCNLCLKCLTELEGVADDWAPAGEWGASILAHCFSMNGSIISII